MARKQVFLLSMASCKIIQKDEWIQTAKEKAWKNISQVMMNKTEPWQNLGLEDMQQQASHHITKENDGQKKICS